MNSFLNKMERKIGKYSIKKLPLIMLMTYAMGYILYLLKPEVINYLTLNPYRIVGRGEVWRLVSWLLIPPYDMMKEPSYLFFMLLMLYFYYSIATTLEKTWGSFWINVYVFGGIIFTILGAFAMYFVDMQWGLMDLSDLLGEGFEGIRYKGAGELYTIMFSSYYINMSIFLAYAATYGDAIVLLFLILPIKVKVLGIIYGVILIIDIIRMWPFGLFFIGASLINFVIFYFSTRKILKSPIQHMFAQKRAQAADRMKQQEERKKAYRANAISKHKCAICGRTNDSNPELEFRFCSKCEGNYEYCQDHLFSHTHKKREL